MRCSNDLGPIVRVLGLEVGINRVSDQRIVQLCTTKLVPTIIRVRTCGILGCALEGFQIGKENIHRLGMFVTLLEDNKSLLIQPVLITESNLSNFITVIIIQTVNVIHNTSFVS